MALYRSPFLNTETKQNRLLVRTSRRFFIDSY
jgi:hypothetical protein